MPAGSIPGQKGARSSRQIGRFDRAEGYHPTNNSHAAQGKMGETPSILNMALPPDLTKTGKEQVRRRRLSWRSVLRGVKWTVITLVVVGVFGGGFLFVKGYINVHKAFKGSGHTALALQPNADLSAFKTEGDGRVNILLLGIGGIGHEAPDLTDTMLIASIDPVNHSAVLTSIPRDLWVAVPHHGNMKINAAYETGKFAALGGKIIPGNANTDAVKAGFASADSVVSQVTGLSIQYNVLVDFQAFQKAVDTVGGVTINVPTALYDPTMAWENKGNPVLAKAGVQTFDGLHALFYVRSRETTSDFARAQRQRAVIVALMQKVFTLGTLSNPLKITQLLDAFGNNVVTDISLGDMTKIYGVTKGINLDTIQSVGLADPPNNYVTTGRVGTQSVVLPRAGQNNYGPIQAYLRSVLPDGYITKEHAAVELVNGTGSTAALTSKETLLKSYGYNLSPSIAALTGNYPKTMLVDLSGGKDPYTAHYLENRFGVKATTKLPAGVTANGAAFVLILGQDQT